MVRDPGSEASILLKIGLLPHLSGYFDIWDFHVWHPGISICSAPTLQFQTVPETMDILDWGTVWKSHFCYCFDYNTLKLWVCFSTKTKQARSHLHFAPTNFKNRWVDLENWTFEVAKVNLEIQVTSSIMQVVRTCVHSTCTGTRTQQHTGRCTSAGEWKTSKLLKPFCNFKRQVLQVYSTVFKVFWCKMKVRSCLFCFCWKPNSQFQSIVVKT